MTLIIVITLVLILLIWITIQVNKPLHKGPASDHFNGKHFYYKERFHSFWDMLKWAWEMKVVRWPKWITDRPQPKPEERVAQGDIKVTYINHGTMLIQLDGVNILTDPIWSMRSGPFGMMGPKRVRNPGVKIEDLPHIDLILISHDHYDHLDIKTMKILVQKYNPQILVGLGVRSLLKSDKFPKVAELDWWQEYNIPSSINAGVGNTSHNIRITFVPARHYSGRTLLGNNRTLWGGFVIEGSKGRIYYAGDSAYDEFLNEIKERFGNFRLTILPLGSYEKSWYMKTQHMNPEEAALIHKLLQSRQSIGTHYATFAEHPEQTIDAHERDLDRALKKYDIAKAEFWVLSFGEGRYVPE